MKQIAFTVSIPTDAGFLGRTCPAASCGRYFKVHHDDMDAALRCPYCSHSESPSGFATKQQARHVERQAAEHAREYMSGEIDKMFRGLARTARGTPGLTIRHSSRKYRARRLLATYQEQAVDSELACSRCEFRFQVYGVFGFCPGCGLDNQLVYDTTLAAIREQLQSSPEDTRVLRHAYADLVSMFEIRSRRAMVEERRKGINFQRLFDVRRVFKAEFGVDILADLQSGQILVLRRLFHKRHAHQHDAGMVTERYVRNVPEDRALLGSTAPLSQDEFENAAKVLRPVLEAVLRLRPPDPGDV